LVSRIPAEFQGPPDNAAAVLGFEDEFGAGRRRRYQDRNEGQCHENHCKTWGFPLHRLLLCCNIFNNSLSLNQFFPGLKNYLAMRPIPLVHHLCESGERYNLAVKTQEEREASRSFLPKYYPQIEKLLRFNVQALTMPFEILGNRGQQGAPEYFED
jgi:hypothetical protein